MFPRQQPEILYRDEPIDWSSLNRQTKGCLDEISGCEAKGKAVETLTLFHRSRITM